MTPTAVPSAAPSALPTALPTSTPTVRPHISFGVLMTADTDPAGLMESMATSLGIAVDNIVLVGVEVIDGVEEEEKEVTAADERRRAR